MKKEEKFLKIGVLGCGPISQAAHLEACRKSRNAELYAICDVADDLLEKMAIVSRLIMIMKKCLLIQMWKLLLLELPISFMSRWP